MIKGFAHVGLYTDCFDKTIEFYQKVFAASEIGRFQTDVRGCWMRIGDDILEIFESQHYGEGSFKHIAIACDNVDELYLKAIKYGALELIKPKDIVLGFKEPIKARIAFIKGVNGEEIELFYQYA